MKVNPGQYGLKKKSGANLNNGLKVMTFKFTVTNEKTPEDQLDLWIKGKSVHTDEGFCCPDHSCCYPGLLAEQYTRERFVRAIDNGEGHVVRLMKYMFDMLRHQYEGIEIVPYFNNSMNYDKNKLI